MVVVLFDDLEMLMEYKDFLLQMELLDQRELLVAGRQQVEQDLLLIFSMNLNLSFSVIPVENLLSFLTVMQLLQVTESNIELFLMESLSMMMMSFQQETLVEEFQVLQTMCSAARRLESDCFPLYLNRR